MTTNVIAQEFIDSSSFESKTAKGITVVEFWAEWNSTNEVSFLPQLKDCIVYKVCITKSYDVSSEFDITSIPTLIIFNNGVEQVRYNPNILMQTTTTKKALQKTIDNIMFSKFQ